MSLFQSIQKQLGKTASDISKPTIGKLSFERINRPLVGFLPNENYALTAPDARSIPCEKSDAIRKQWEIDFRSPGNIAIRLLTVPRNDAVSLIDTPGATEIQTAAWKGFAGEMVIKHEALLSAFETQALQQQIHTAVREDLFSTLEDRPEVIPNQHERLRNRIPMQTEDCLRLLLNRELVTKDLLKPLVKVPRIDGKQYLEKAPANDCESVTAESPRTGDAGVSENLGNRKAFTQERGKVKAAMNVWDLMLPLLQRPVGELDSTVDLPINLYPYQTKGVEFLMDHTSALLGDDMGTGKTVQTSVAIRMLFQTGKIRSAVIVCPLSVIPNWDRELAKLAGNLGVTVVRGDKKHRKICWRQSAHIWLTTYDTLRNDIDDVLLLRKGGFDLLALDEAQRVKNGSSGVTQAVRKVRAKYRWGLTGTPLENNADELLTILNVVKPDITWSQSLQETLRPLFLRRRKQDVLTDLPPIVQNTKWLHLEAEQRRSYDELEEKGILELHSRGETITAHTIIVLLNKLKQVCNLCPRTGESSKMAWLKDRLEVITAEGDKALIFSQFVDERFGGADWMEKELSGFGVLNYANAASDLRRKNLLSAFKEKQKHKVFVGHPKTAGLGLNELVVANYVIHFDHWWNPAVMNQATARAHRPGQTKTVFAYDLWIEGTYEELIYKQLEQKQGLYNEVIDSMSTQRAPGDHLAFAVADNLFAKYGLNPVRRK